jgi:hypothetical protein
MRAEGPSGKKLSEKNAYFRNALYKADRTAKSRA